VLHLVGLIRVICVVTPDIVNGDMLMHTCMNRKLCPCCCSMGCALIVSAVLVSTHVSLGSLGGTHN